MGVFIALASLNPRKSAAAFVAAEGERFAAALRGAEAEDPRVAAELVALANCDKSVSRLVLPVPSPGSCCLL